MEEIGVVDLFCGIGGLSHGLYKEGFNIIAGIDTDETCRYAFEENNESEFINRSVKDICGDDINRLFGDVETKILVGCAPCQPFSSYTFKDKEKENDKWDLLYEFGRLIREANPHIVVMENVAQLMNFTKAPVLQDFIDQLNQLNFEVSYGIVYGPDYGIPQNRKRLILLASRIGKINLIEKTHSKENYETVRSAIASLPHINAGEYSLEDPIHYARSLSKKNLERIINTPYGGSWKDWPEELLLECHKKDSGKSYPSVYGRMKWDEPSPTITTHCTGYGNGRFGHPIQNRAISLREAGLLQTFPIDFKFAPDTNNFNKSVIARQIGNAVPVRLGEVIGKSIKNHLENH